MNFKQIYEFKEYGGLIFLKLLYHNSSRGEYFNKENVYFHISKNTFSLLSLLDDDFRVGEDSVFEFILEYPEFKGESKGFYHWKQKVTPLIFSDDISYVSLSEASFDGLSRSADNTKTLLDGNYVNNQTNNWWFSVGTYEEFGQKEIPGPIYNNKYFWVSCVTLWIRFDSNYDLLNKLYSLQLNCSIIEKKFITLSCIFFISIIL